MTHRDPLFALRRSARNLQNSELLIRFGELNAGLTTQSKPLYVVFVHGGLSCCFDAFEDLFHRIESNLRTPGANAGAAIFLRFEHDTYHPISVNAERLCELVTDKLSQFSGAGQEAELLLIAHSRGGLVARLASDILIERGLWSKGRLEVFTFGSPHLGTPFFESEVTLAVDYLIRFAGILGYGLLRFLYRSLRNGPLREIRCHVRAWRRPGMLLGNTAGPSVLAYRRLVLNCLVRRTASIRTQGPSILRWPPGIEDVRESSEFIRRLSPVPRCPRFWTFGSTYDVRVNSQKLDVLSMHVLRMVQRAFILASRPGGSPATAQPTEQNDLVVTLESATAVGKAFHIRENLWHCGYFKGSPGEKLARYLEDLILARSTGAFSHRPLFDEAA
jgi:pimeloyl-ACP methyl ester carboxylesterase